MATAHEDDVEQVTRLRAWPKPILSRQQAEDRVASRDPKHEPQADDGDDEVEHEAEKPKRGARKK